MDWLFKVSNNNSSPLTTTKYCQQRQNKCSTKIMMPKLIQYRKQYSSDDDEGNFSEETTINNHQLKSINENDQLLQQQSAAAANDKNDADNRQSIITSDIKLARSRFRRTRSLNAPNQCCQFGPCGSIMKNPAMVMTIQDPASQRLIWHKTPASVLVIKKIHDSLIIKPFLDLVQWLIWEKNMTVFIETSVLEDVHLKNNPLFLSIKDNVRTFRDGKENLTDKVDFIVCLGGDGTLLYASSLFQESVPPVMAFHMGSLGFLTPFEFDDFQQQINNVLKGNAALTLRSRLCCNIVRDNDSSDIFINNGDNSNSNNIPKNHCHLVLNEMVVDRGPSPYLSNVDLYIDGKRITTVQGDGLIVSTPTGSTAYAVAAGASMIHPSVPAIMITPICPHSLSFRPIVVPAGVELKICVSPDSRNSAWVSFDGRNRQEIKVGDSVRVTTSIYPVPSICSEDQISDWFDSLAECLHWNVRQKQKQFDEYSDLIHSSSSSVSSLDK
ncbi:NAD kinase-like isoform X1 [Dermatophagoides pteronyssinus]|uniref:NAD kinase-like isoform X1 n=2 Tax=Dermatophagoides pteronyssinus TaxID=6956 RepID=UPI003F666FE9